MDGNSKYLGVSESSDLLGISKDTIRRWERKGLIKSTRSEYNYRLFSLKELQRIQRKMNGDHSIKYYRILKTSKRSGFTSIELFAGAGGTALGLHNAGINHIFLNELNEDCVKTLKKNQPNWNVVLGDVANINFKGMNADIVQGGFPCQSFSYAGKGLGLEDTRGTLFYEFARCVKEVRPKIAMGENVKGLLKHDQGKTLEIMVKVLENLGYKVAYKVLRAQYLDVPQKRERLIILAIRNDLDIPFIFPKEKDYIVTVREALENVPESDGQKYPEKKKKVMDLIPQGGYWKDLPEDIKKEYMGGSYYLGGGKTGMARRLAWDEPSLTLTCAPAQKQTERCHPNETRPLTVREYARIQTFPDEWEFVGSTTSQYKQIGNAVPVNLGFHLGRSLIAMLNNSQELNDFEVMTEFAPTVNVYQGSLFV
ncbi:DNA (cytosine-5-)-methyltransferase [candidate division WWE3 bacterium RIFCSPLOWO2_01_FULL_39_13]|uniref:Cytosine-specific methyltransferase n=1 Tax=candidate division WWE3 bacterium RIFCSPLOWO2_01_FULL_39_13 TaxID=1802624 RepID=A0A1F4V1U1_UNCKA|nr:MAG: DNA (cytosine-5-)-methyltransferase [candidate division WWE3 bacterium RIFCSPLOWO2_01_FULL_39_13]